MQIRMQRAEGRTKREKQIEEFIEASQGIDFRGESRSEVYDWIQGVLVAQDHTSRGSEVRYGPTCARWRD